MARAGFVATRAQGAVDLLATPTVGVLRWGDGWDPTIRLEAGLRFNLQPGVELETAVRVERVWISSRAESVVVAEREVDMIGIAFGVRFTRRE
jgi:hypothetical protein